MRCPECRAEIPDDLKICSVCNALLDAGSLVETDLEGLWEDEQDKEPTFPPGRPPGRPARPATPSPRGSRRRTPSVPAARAEPEPDPRMTGPFPAFNRRPSQAAPPSEAWDPSPQQPRSGGAFPPAPGQASIDTRIVKLDPEADRGTQIVDISLPPQVKKAVRDKVREEKAAQIGHPSLRRRLGAGLEESSISRGIDDLMTSMRMFYARMHRLDRWAAGALALAFLCSFLPWVRVRGVELLAGIQDFGAGSAVMSVLTFLCIFFRIARRRLTAILTLLQMVSSAALTSIPVYRLLSTGEEHEISFGLYLTILAGMGAIVLSLLRLARINA